MRLIQIGKRIVNLDKVITINRFDDDDYCKLNILLAAQESDDSAYTTPYLFQVSGDAARELWSYLENITYHITGREG